MNPAYILPLDSTRADLQTVGGKGMSLSRLSRLGLPVPDGFHITTEAYRLFVEKNALQQIISKALEEVESTRPTTLETASAQIYKAFVKTEIPDELKTQILDAYHRLPAQQALESGNDLPVAVRSSATAEDLPEASFAGQQETYLNIRGQSDLLEAVKKCWASLWTARAIGYRTKQGLGTDGIALAIVVQKLVPADAAGILFTANPINGKRNQQVINAAWGLGEAIVGGAVTPDTLVVDKTSGEIISRETAEKQVMTVRTDLGAEEKAVPGRMQKKPVLSDLQAVNLARLGKEIENQYGMPMDIEWAMIGNEFYILQARPITALPDAIIEWIPPDPKGTYMRTSVADLMPEPLSPLYVSLGIPAQRDQMQPLGKRMVGKEPVLARDYITSINNYAYMNAAMSPGSWWWAITGLIPAYPKLLRSLVPLFRDELLPEYQAFVNSKKELQPESLSPAELWKESRELVDAFAYYVCGLMFATMGASAGSEGLTTQVYNKLAKQEGDPDASVLLMGWNNIPVRSEKSMYDIAMWVREDQPLANYITDTPIQELLTVLENPGNAPTTLFSEFAYRLQTHMETFGHTIFQLDFAEPLPLDHPEMMLESIRMYLNGKGTNPYERQAASEQKRIQTTEIMLQRLKGFKLWVFKKALNWGQSMAEVREDALAEIGLAYPKIRELLHELGRRLAAAQVIRQPEDIFWLEKEGIDSCIEKLEQDQALPDLANQVTERKTFHKRLKQLSPPSIMPMKKRVMGMKTEVFLAHTQDNQITGVLKGVSTSAGKVTAAARILHGPEDFHLMQPGDVLVAGTTTPAWTPLFTMASAVVTDIGGPLSHGSIVAREYGIPAVMGTGVATTRIRNGQTITVDGTNGEVILHEDDETTGSPAPPMEWKTPDPKSVYARGSLAEHIPSPVSPLFATLGLEIANQSTDRLWKEFVGMDPSKLFPAGGFYLTINSYVYGGFRMGLREFGIITKMTLAQMGPIFRNAPKRYHEARKKLAAVVDTWEQKTLATMNPSELLQGIKTVFGAACDYYTVIQTTLPAASMSEILLGRFYSSLIKRKGDPELTSLLFGIETALVRAEKSLYDIAARLQEDPVLCEYVSQTTAGELAGDFLRRAAPAKLTSRQWNRWLARLDEHFERFGRTAYEFDFINPTPAEAPVPALEAIKQFMSGQAVSPYVRHESAAQKRIQATRDIQNRIRWPRKNWFDRLLRWAQETGAIREDSLIDMGMGHPIIRKMLAELGSRFAAARAIDQTEDIYWLEGLEVEDLVSGLEAGRPLPDLSARIPDRQATWQAALKATPPVMLPEKSGWAKLIGNHAPQEKDGRIILTGVGTSEGEVTGPACVLFGSDDFTRMRPGDVLVAVTTTPAWTPLFSLAAAVVTDIGGPLSHSSIVAREYGIPAVMAVRNATRHIQSGQIITVNGKQGTVVLEK
ncbi:MAG: hypothetical protein JXA13_07395 [Anaerolineales bacterium]|nr:hypothetical protein [Anaerolineales bacterium]